MSDAVKTATETNWTLLITLGTTAVSGIAAAFGAVWAKGNRQEEECKKERQTMEERHRKELAAKDAECDALARENRQLTKDLAVAVTRLELAHEKLKRASGRTSDPPVT